MEIFALIAALLALYMSWGIPPKLRLQDERLADLQAQITRLKLAIVGQTKDAIEKATAKQKNKPKKKTKESGPWATARTAAALKSTGDKISGPLPELAAQQPVAKTAADPSSWPKTPAAKAPDKVEKTVAAKDSVVTPEDRKLLQEPVPDAASQLSDDTSSPKKPKNPPVDKPTSGAWEALIGGQWAVWVGGIALALGGIFLVRYSIEAGMLGPKVRLVLAALFGLALLAAGEFIRRRSIDIAIAKINSAYVPGILTAAGSMVLFAAIYAAFGVFHFIQPGLAFILMGAVSITTLSLALLHGPSLAALGLLGSYVTPVLVSTARPNYFALFLFLVVVTATALLLARWRQWVWLVWASAFGALGWAATSVGLGGTELLRSYSLGAYLVALAVIYCAHAVNWLAPVLSDKPSTEKSKDLEFAFILLGISAALGLIVYYYVQRSSFTLDTIVVAAIVIISMSASAWLRAQLSAMFSIAAGVALTVFTGWSLQDVVISLPTLFSRSFTLSIAAIGEPAISAIFVGAPLAAITIIAGTIGLLRHITSHKFRTEAIWWALPVSIVPLGVYLASWISQGASGSTGLLITGIFGVLALAAASEMILRRAPSLTSQGLFEVLPLTLVAGSGAALAIATLVFNYSDAALVVLLTLLALALAGLSVIRPVVALRYGAAAAAAVAIARVVADPVLGLAPGPTIIFNSILPAYGLPIVALGGAGWLLGKWGKDAPQRFLEGAAVLFAALLFTLEIRHGMNDGNIYAKEYTLAEQAAHTITALIMSGAMMRLDDRSPSVIFRGIMQLLGYVSLAMVVFMHGYSLNPLVTNEPVGSGYFFNLLLIGFLLPGLIAGVVHWLARTRRDAAYVTALEATTWLLLVGWVLLSIRHFNVGERIGWNFHPIPIPEAFAHTLAILSIVAIVTYSYRWLFAQWKSRILPYAGYAALAVIVLVNLLLGNPLFANDQIITRHTLVLLLIGYLLPGLIAASIHWRVRTWRNIPYTIATEAIAWLLLSGWAFLTIRQAYVGKSMDLFLNPVRMVEAYNHILVALMIIAAVAVAYRFLFANWKSRVMPIALGGTIFAFVISNFFIFMPWQRGLLIGDGFIVNQLLPGFFIPAMLWLTIRHLWKSIGDWQIPQLSRILGGLALVSGFAWATFMVRHAWHGSHLYHGAFYATETYAYSAVWLTMGVAILLLSSWRGAQDLRVASAAVIFITVLKVFLYDMSALEGVLRALSFIGLGIVLIAIGLFYQRLLFRERNPTQLQDTQPNE